MTQERRTEDGARLGDSHGHVSVSTERTGEGTVYRAEPRVTATAVPAMTAAPMTAPAPVIDRHTETFPPRDKIRWGPVLAGLVTTVASMLLLSVLGLAIGASAFEVTSDGSDVGMAAAIWTAASALISFFLGGWVAGKTASVHGTEHGLLNGFMVGATALALILWLTSTGLGNLLGGLGTNIGDIAAVGASQVSGSEASNAADQARTQAVQAYDEARNGAWGTFAGLALALGAATVGGLLGHKTRHDHSRGAVADAG